MNRAALLIACTLAVSANALEITGAVYGKDGNALAGAKVSAVVPVAKTKLGETTTSDDGAFVLKDLPEGVIGIETSGMTAYALAGDDVTINVWDARENHAPDAPRGDRSVSGIIRLDGKPLPNAPIWIHPNGNDYVKPIYAVSNAKGEFRVTGLAPQPWIVTIEPSLISRVRAVIPAEQDPPFVVDLTDAKEATSNIDLVSPPFIRGRVIDAGGKPVARTRVQLVFANRQLFDIPTDMTPRTDAAGRFAIPAPQWEENTEICVAVLGPQQSPVRSKSFPLPTNDQTVDITLPRFDDVRVRITERNGNPVRNARFAFVSTSESAGSEALPYKAIAVSESGELALRLVPDTYELYATAEGFQTRRWNAQPAPKMDVILEREAILRGRVHRGEDGVYGVEVSIAGKSDPIRTDEHGAFEIKGLAPGTYRLDITKPDALIDRKVVVQAPGEADVALPPLGTLDARVVDAESGAPVRETVYFIEDVEQNGNLTGMTEPEDATFSIGLPEGTYRVRAVAQDRPPSAPVEVRIHGGETTTIDIALSRGITVTGSVLDESGDAIADASVSITPEDDAIARARGPAQTTTDEYGAFTLPGIEQGTPAVLSVRRDGYVPFRKAIDPQSGMELDVRLSEGLSIRGVVMSGGKPVMGAMVGVITPAAGMNQQEMVTDEDGRFVITGLADARYRVTASSMGSRVVIENVDPSARKELVLTLDSAQHGILYGTILGYPPNLGGKIVRRAVMAYGGDDSAEALIDDAGNYRMENAPTGSVVVWAQIDSSTQAYRMTAHKEVEVAPGQSLRVDLQLPSALRVSGRVTFEHRPLDDAVVGFSAPDESMTTARTNGQGMYETTLPLEGNYLISVGAEQVPTFAMRREVRGGDRIDIEFQQDTIEGVILDAATRRPVPHANVNLTQTSDALPVPDGEVKADASGRFRANAPSGELHVYVSAPGYAPRTVITNSAARSIVIALDPAAELNVRVTDARSGAPLEVLLLLQDTQGAYVFAPPVVSTDGSTYRFSLSPTKYVLTVTADGYESKVLEVTAPGTIDVKMQ